MRFGPARSMVFFEFFDKELDNHLDYKFHNRRLEKYRAKLTAVIFEFLHLSLAHDAYHKLNDACSRHFDVKIAYINR